MYRTIEVNVSVQSILQTYLYPLIISLAFSLTIFPRTSNLRLRTYLFPITTLPSRSSVIIKYILVTCNNFSLELIALSQLGASSYIASSSKIDLSGSIGPHMPITDTLYTTVLEKTFFFRTRYNLLSVLLLRFLLLLAYKVSSRPSTSSYKLVVDQLGDQGLVVLIEYPSSLIVVSMSPNVQ